ncbi:heavy-metal-associated domain-containing protein [Marinisporobacter balticus]|uniref:Copper ion binding protein n=1 Tax=Marinisporobacter balticus TaxID=2018667 RepID=A0A4R2KW08_9FIRM|nr:heavy metal-associated domain-containing protein [Marinisporobacter balticus]TCO78701.1 copper ion binding protein [Marinisporobacter balticus]
MKIIMKIEGMSCNHCVNHVKNALEEITGVKTVEVDLQRKNAVIELSQDGDHKVLKEAVEEAGYEVVEMEEI